MTEEPGEIGEHNPFYALRQIARKTATRVREEEKEEHCDLCGETIGPDHRHLLNVNSREILCACRACAFLLDSPAAGGGQRKLIPTRCLHLADFHMTDAQWESLQIPVGMAFFCYSTPAQRMMAFYPSPMGPTESTLSLAAWDDLAAQNPILQQMQPDVEALLVNRKKDVSLSYLVPIDECYKLVGAIRLHWRGFSGGSAVHEQIAQFFARLEQRSATTGGSHA